ncbi:MAG: 23S rRNA (guanosine(2251)-2'-O)-methyltransferase RlmB, partial [Firmicutes bacterium]|nr:23S rRNA (guanosine(2251)-2'-O)-methyltransferase RlmB [Bacillota bacterium]
MAKVKNRRDNHNIKRPKSGAGYGESGGTRELRDKRPPKDISQKRSFDRSYDRGPQRPRFDRPVFEKDENVIIGRNPVTEALKAGREVDKLLVTSREGSMIKILAMAKDQGIPVMYVEKAALDRISGGQAHQGVAAYVSPYSYSSVEEILARAAERDEDPFIIILDGIEDPHNLGAIMRTAECAGAHGVIIPKRHSATLTETVAKASAVAIEYMPVAKVTNIAQTIDELKDMGIWVAACDMGGTEYYRSDVSGKIAVVIGSEGFGISKLVREKCD